MNINHNTGIYFIVLLCASIIAGCTEEKVKSKMSFDNNNECGAWRETNNTIRFPNAHSGNFVCKLKKDSAFSTVLDIRVKDISDKPLKRAKITAWFMLTSHATEQNLVMDVRDSANQNSFEWINVDAADYTNELNTWSKAELVIDLTKKDRNNMNNVYRIYASNGKDEPVYVDDFEVSFEN